MAEKTTPGEIAVVLLLYAALIPFVPWMASLIWAEVCVDVYGLSAVSGWHMFIAMVCVRMMLPTEDHTDKKAMDMIAMGIGRFLIWTAIYGLAVWWTP